MAVVAADDSTWELCNLYTPNLEALKKEDVMDVLKMAMRPRPPFERPGRSRAVMEAYNALQADPYNMRSIHDLGRIYCSEGAWDKAANVMLRGWKRADEITDKRVRFHFLMKLCECSFRISKPRQAFAVLNTIEPPLEADDLHAYQMLMVQVYSSVGDVQKVLSTWKKAITNQDYQTAVRMLALCLEDLRTAGAFDAVRNSVAALQKDDPDLSSLAILDQYVRAKEEVVKANAIMERNRKAFIVLVVIVAILMMIYPLYLLEKWSLRSLKIQS
mmetsp:Transcript_5941/g.9477  ORF Transcript_5941/g.9477 Transcript_5941/m.9477 type:complete len:273 (+) Transcript_5941:75-893(+)